MTATASYYERRAERERDLVARYGEVLTLADIAQVLRYPSLAAARQARVRGTLPVPVAKLALGRKWVATARAVAEVLVRLDLPQAIDGDKPMT